MESEKGEAQQMGEVQTTGPLVYEALMSRAAEKGLWGLGRDPRRGLEPSCSVSFPELRS